MELLPAMLYYFIINGRSDKSQIQPELEKMLSGYKINRQTYVTQGVGDATRVVNLYCDLNPRSEVCFVACGGAGTTNEVASALVGRENKYLAILNFGGTNDFIKYYPERDFHNIEALLDGEAAKVDAIKANDNYAINVVEFGLDSHVAIQADHNIKIGLKDPYGKAVVKSMLFHRFNRMRVTADGERMNWRFVLLGTIANGRYCGGQFLTAPRAVNDDGLMEVLVMKSLPLLLVALIMKKYTEGRHLEDKFCMRLIKYRRAKHVELKSKDLIYLSLDGEIIASSSFKIDVLEKSLNLILPKV